MNISGHILTIDRVDGNIDGKIKVVETSQTRSVLLGQVLSDTGEYTVIHKDVAEDHTQFTYDANEHKLNVYQISGHIASFDRIGVTSELAVKEGATLHLQAGSFFAIDFDKGSDSTYLTNYMTFENDGEPDGFAELDTWESTLTPKAFYFGENGTLESDKRLKTILDTDVSVSGSLSRLKSLNTVKFKYNEIYWNRKKHNVTVSAYKINEDEEYYGFIADDINKEYVHINPYDYPHFSVSSTLTDKANGLNSLFVPLLVSGNLYTQPKKDSEGNIIYKTDSEGNFMYESTSGKIVEGWEREIWKTSVSGTLKDVKGINFEEITADLVNLCLDQQTRIDSQETKINTLETKINTQETTITSLLARVTALENP